jgi:hypothetical protein
LSAQKLNCYHQRGTNARNKREGLKVGRAPSVVDIGTGLAVHTGIQHNIALAEIHIFDMDASGQRFEAYVVHYAKRKNRRRLHGYME